MSTGKILLIIIIVHNGEIGTCRYDNVYLGIRQIKRYSDGLSPFSVPDRVKFEWKYHRFRPVFYVQYSIYDGLTGQRIRFNL